MYHPYNDSVVNNFQEEAHGSVPMNCPEKFLEISFAPDTDVTPAFILGLGITKRNLDDDVGANMDFTV